MVGCGGEFYIDMRNDRNYNLFTDELFKLEGWIYMHAFFCIPFLLTIYQFWFPKTVMKRILKYLLTIFFVVGVFGLMNWEFIEWVISSFTKQFCALKGLIGYSFCADWFGDSPTMMWGDMIMGTIGLLFLIQGLVLCDCLEWEERPFKDKVKRIIVILVSLIPQLFTMFFYRVDVCREDIQPLYENLKYGSNLVPYGFWLAIISFWMVMWNVMRIQDHQFADPERVDALYYYISLILVFTGLPNALWLFSTYIVTITSWIILEIIIIINWSSFSLRKKIKKIDKNIEYLNLV